MGAMKRTLSASILLSALLTCHPSFAQEPTAEESQRGAAATLAQDTGDVQHVMDAFHEAVIHHDGKRLASLFIAEGSTWLNVLSDEAYARARAASPTPPKVRVGSYQDFVKFVTTSKADLNPVHTNLQVHSDGTVASVYFDFVFMIDGKEQNRGSETWQLVKGDAGWRIVALTYSSNPSAR